MRAVVFHGAGDLRVEDVPEPTVGSGDVLLRPYYAQVCLTDVLNYERWPAVWDPVAPSGRPAQQGGRWVADYTLGMVPGHEGGGEVVAVGADVPHLRPGDRVLVDAVFRCGSCAGCHRMLPLECQYHAARTNRPDHPGPLFLGVNSGQPEAFGRGLMAELCAVPASMCYPCGPGVTDLATVAGEIGGITLTSVRTSGMQLGDNVVQVGGQLYGSYRLQLARLAGADHLAYVEPSATLRRWAVAHQLADLVVDPGAEDPVAAVRGLMPAGADVVFASATVPGSWATALKLVRRGGSVVPFDADPRLGDDHLSGFDGSRAVRDGVRWLGSWPPVASADVLKGGQDRNDHRIVADLMGQGRLDGGLPVTMIASLWDEPADIVRCFTEPWRSEVRTAVRIWGR